ncbi:MAG: FKBP-type peptidyl-prolyl cis-trans isomerase [Marmoricola sp.]
MNLRPVLRASAPIAVAATLTLTLAACGSSAKTPNASKSSPSASPSADAGNGCNVKPGSVSNAVTVSGAYGKTPTVTVKGALKATSVQRTITIKGTGPLSVTGDTINAHLSLFDGTGKKIVDQDAQVPLGNTVRPVFRDALTCVAYGSRTVVTAPASQVYQGGQLPAGVKAADTLILVTDIKSKYTPPAPPKPAAWTTQVPTVTFNSKGVPSVKLNGKPINQFAMKILRQGTGPVVKNGDSATVNYYLMNWTTGKFLQSSFGTSQPFQFSTSGGAVTGFTGAVVGQKVGTRLVVVLPPKYAYGEKASAQNTLGGQTLVFVIEILKAGS